MRVSPSRRGTRRIPRRDAGKRAVQIVPGARGRTGVPKIVNWYPDAKIAIEPLITPKTPLGRINDAFDILHAGEPLRGLAT
jgi:Zn-dependent alcohol dehydrogenase